MVLCADVAECLQGVSEFIRFGKYSCTLWKFDNLILSLLNSLNGRNCNFRFEKLV